MRFRTLHLLSVIALAFCTAPVSAQPFELTFWPSPSASTDPRVTKMLEHPCGEVAVAKVLEMPPYKKDGVLIPERVFELDAKSKVVAEWAIPVDSYVRAVRGATIIVEHGASRYEIARGGRIRLLTAKDPLPEPKPVECQIPQALQPSAYARCEQFQDLGSKKLRILSYEMTCT